MLMKVIIMDYGKLDDIAAPDKYVTPSSQADLEYIIRFRQTCKRYHIDFSTADPDEKDFVMRMAEKQIVPRRV